MSLKVDRVELEIVIKNDENRKQLRVLEDDMRRVRKELKKLPEGTDEWIKKSAELKQMQARYDAIYEKIGLAGLSIKELRNRQNELNSIIKQLPGNSPLLERYRQQLKEVTARIKEVNGQAEKTGFSLSKLSNGINKYFGLITAGIATITGISMAFRKTATDVAKMDDVYSDVMKTTGLTRDEVLALNEEFKKMDTRTSRESLNRLARDAGKLGIEGTENIMDFVDAGNQINVALGEDLGDDAIKNIGKMVGVYKDATQELQDAGLKEQMLAVGSAINDIGANSSADESFLVEFAGRLGGISRQAGIAIDDILGYASALDQDMQQMEMSSTAFSNFIQKLMGNPAKFAKLAGLEVKSFTRLVSTDANAAIKQVLRSLNDKGGFQALIPIFQDMGLDGARAVGVLSSMAASIDKVDAAQKLANDSMQTATSVSNEYGIKNENLAAKLDKAKKEFFEVSLKLGESLNPVLLKTTNLTTYLIRGLVKLIPHLPTIGKLLVMLTGYYVAYNAKIIVNNLLLKEGIGLQLKQTLQRVKDAIVLEALVVKEALHVAVVNKATVATKAAAAAQVLWNMTMKNNPLGWFIGLLTTAAGLYFLLRKRTDLNTESLKAQMSVQEKVDEQYGSQAAKIDRLVSILNNEKIALDKRNQALKDLKAIIPGYHADLTKEGKLINYNKEAVSQYLSQLEKEIRLKASQEELEQLYREKRKAEQKKKAADDALASVKSKPNTPAVSGKEGKVMDTSGAISYAEATKNADNANNHLLGINRAIAKLEAEVSSNPITVNTGIEIGSTKIGEDGKTYKWDGKKWVFVPDTSDLSSGDGKDSNAAAVKKLEQQQLAEEVAEKKKLQSKEALDAAMIALEEKYLVQKRDLYAKGSAGWNTYEDKRLDLEKSKTASANDVMLKSIESAHQATLNSLDTFDQEERERLQDKLDADGSFQQQYNSEMLALDVALAEKRLREAEEYAALIRDAKFNTEEEKQKAVTTAEAAITAEKKTLTKARRAVTKNKLQDEKEYQDKVAKLREDLGLNKEKLSYQEGLKALKKKLKDAEASEKESADAILAYKLDKVEQYATAAAQITQTLSDAVRGFQDAELTAVDTKYDKMIRAAEEAGKDTTDLEEEKERAQAKIKAKYADANFVVTVAQITASTAAAAISSYKAMAEIPVIGPELGAAAAAAAVLYGASQIKQAKAARDEAKAGYKSGGYTPTGSDDDEVGPAHANEFYVRADGVRNPAVRKFLDVFDVAQKNGTIRMLNTTQILERTKLTGGAKKTGGFTSEIDASRLPDDPNNDSGLSELLERNLLLYAKLLARLDVPLKAEAVISGSDGVYEKTLQYEKLLGNAGR